MFSHCRRRGLMKFCEPDVFNDSSSLIYVFTQFSIPLMYCKFWIFYISCCDWRHFHFIHGSHSRQKGTQRSRARVKVKHIHHKKVKNKARKKYHIEFPLKTLSYLNRVNFRIVIWQHTEIAILKIFIKVFLIVSMVNMFSYLAIQYF